jgi:prevent-host-death family protein
VHFGEIYRRVTENDETIVIERNGRPGAVIISIDAYEALTTSGAETGKTTESDLPDWYLNMLEVAAEFRAAHKGEPMTDGVKLIQASREERDAELLDRLS